MCHRPKRANTRRKVARARPIPPAYAQTAPGARAPARASVRRGECRAGSIRSAPRVRDRLPGIAHARVDLIRYGKCGMYPEFGIDDKDTVTPMLRPYRAPLGTDDFYEFGHKKQCDDCGRAFMSRGGPWSAPYFCSEECQRNSRNLRRNAKRREGRELREQITCECGNSFTPDRSTRRYCSDKCRQKAYRNRAASR